MRPTSAVYRRRMRDRILAFANSNALPSADEASFRHGSLYIVLLASAVTSRTKFCRLKGT